MINTAKLKSKAIYIISLITRPGGVFLKRLPIILIFVFLIVLMYFGESGVFDTEFSFTPASHIRMILRHTDGMNSGYYLGHSPDRSYVRGSYYDIGSTLFLANKKYLCEVLRLDRKPFSIDDIRSIKLYVLIAAIILLFLPSIPISVSCISSLCIIFIYLLGIDTFNLGIRWAPIISAILTMALLVSIHMRSEMGKVNRVIDLMILSVFLGLLSYLRATGKYISLAPFLIVIVFNCLYLAIFAVRHGCLKRFKYVISLLWNENKNILRVAGFSLLIIFSISILTNIMVNANVSFFELKDKCKHRPLGAGHSFWHPLYEGLGNGRISRTDPRAFFNYESIIWNDNIPKAHAYLDRMAQHRTSEYEPTLKDLFTDIALNDPILILKSVVHKGKFIIDQYSVHFFVFVVASIFVIMKYGFVSCASFFMGVFSLIFVSMVPYVQTHPGFAKPVAASLIVSTVSLAFVVKMINLKYDRKMLISVGKIILVGSVALLIFASGYIGMNRLKCYYKANQFRKGEISYKSFLEGFPENVAFGFNSLPGESRQNLVDLIEKKYGSGLGATLEEVGGQPPGKHIEVLHAAWRGKTLFLFIYLPKDIRKKPGSYGSVIPVKFEDKNAFTVIFLPANIEKGVWLFYCRVNRLFSEKIVIGAPQTYRHSIDHSRKFKPLCEILPK